MTEASGVPKSCEIADSSADLRPSVCDTTRAVSSSCLRSVCSTASAARRQIEPMTRRKPAEARSPGATVLRGSRAGRGVGGWRSAGFIFAGAERCEQHGLAIEDIVALLHDGAVDRGGIAGDGDIARQLKQRARLARLALRPAGLLAQTAGEIA